MVLSGRGAEYQLGQRFSASVVLLRQHVGIDVQRDGRRRVSEETGDADDVLAVRNQQGCERVPEIVKSDLSESGPA